MIPGLRGRLVTATFAESLLATVPGAVSPPPEIVRALDVWAERRASTIGPASSVRAITDVLVIPLLAILGFDVERRTDLGERTILTAVIGSVTVAVLVVKWGEPLERAWRAMVLDGARADARWCLCSNGVVFRVVDAHHTWTRHYLEFDLELVAAEETTRFVFWSLARAASMAACPSTLDRAAQLSAQHGVAVCRALGDGVLNALSVVFQALASNQSGETSRQTMFDHSLTVLYRIVFLLFAEARGLVPVWHPVYRERYSIGTMVTTLLAGGRYRGIWHAILAISRLAHAGCSAGELRVTAFNGRLFAPSDSTSFDRTPIADDVMSAAVMSVSTTSGYGSGRERIAYTDLDVEQLGAVYERVLEYQPTASSRSLLHRTRDARQSSGSFYTPRTVTAFLVRQTLDPLVRDRSAEEILRLRVLDPAMGSGAFLVAACRYLAATIEDRLISEGRWHHGDVTPADRAQIRREVAQRCLFGVDLNPMAVQLARLSLWLATLASDKPLTFLDHHLVCGDSLAGATLEDVCRQPGRGRIRGGRTDPLPLFAGIEIAPALEQAVRTRLRLALDPDDSAAIVAGKDITLSALQRRSPLGRMSRVLDLWCAGWFWEPGAPPTAGVFRDLCDRLLGAEAALPTAAAERLLEHSATLAARYRFLHWPLAFPEVFSDEHGAPLATPGFDAIIGNPPWDMIRGDSGEVDVRVDRRRQARHFTSFIRESGVYQIGNRSHINRYQLFVERALQLTRSGGRIGFVLPSGGFTDTGAAALRRHLLEQSNVDSVTWLDNRGGIFPIHRSLRFVLLTSTVGRPTHSIACRFGVRRSEDLEAAGDNSSRLSLTRDLLARISGADDLAIPDVVTAHDLRMLEAISARLLWLGDSNGWNVRFGRELNATDDRHWFTPYTGDRTARPVLEGKQIEPFCARVADCRYEIPAGGHVTRFARRTRLAYRDVASATNRLTLIAAVIPPHAITTHTLFCLRTPLPVDAQHVLCALLNSYVANYLVRMRVSTHVTASLVARLRAPFITTTHPAFTQLARLSRALTEATGAAEEKHEYAELQGLVAALYGLSDADFARILETFPLIPHEIRARALCALRRCR
jgi:hypothetical protein